jgi:perosamine synthetase
MIETNDQDAPVRTAPLPYGRQTIEEDDIAAVVEVLRSDWLTTGPKVDEFERALERFTGAAHAVVIANGTAALHAAMAALGIGPGDEVIVPAITFVASANCVVYHGGTPIFADVEADTLLIDPADVARKITPRTKAIVAVDYGGHPCDYSALRAVAGGLPIVADACHALGAARDGKAVGQLADLTTLSFHPVKPITTGEGGAILTDNADFAAKMRVFRGHGIVSDFRQREKQGSWAYEMTSLGFNYRLCDMQCALGVRQLAKLPGWIGRRQEIAARYDERLRDHPLLTPLAVRPNVSHGYHLYVAQLPVGVDRGEAFRAFRAARIGVNVHYLPVYLHPFYRDRFGDQTGACPVAEQAYERILSLPIFPLMKDSDVDDVITVADHIARTLLKA